jgi:hypothetical protein
MEKRRQGGRLKMNENILDLENLNALIEQELDNAIKLVTA